MCGRYVTADEAALQQLFHELCVSSAQQPSLAFEVVPTSRAPVVRVLRATGERQAVVMRWGLIPLWARGEQPKDKRTGRPLATFNARIETMRTNSCFRDAWKNGQRCIVPMAGWYEWQAQPPDWQRTVQHYITVEDQPIFFLAGLWERSTKASGEIVESYTVVTMSANQLVGTIHNSKKGGGKRVLLPVEERRMPAVLKKEDVEMWLSGTQEQAWGVLQHYPAELMVATPVNDRSSNAGTLDLPFD